MGFPQISLQYDEYISRLDITFGYILYRKWHGHNTSPQGQNMHVTCTSPLAGDCASSSKRKIEHVWQTCTTQKSPGHIIHLLRSHSFLHHCGPAWQVPFGYFLSINYNVVILGN